MKKRDVVVCLFAFVLLTLAVGVFAQTVHSGQYAARIEWTNAWAPGMDSGLDRDATRIPVTAGHNYTCKAWVKSGTPAGNDVFRFTFAGFDSGGVWLGDDAKAWDSSGGGWQQFTWTHTAVATAVVMNLAFRMVTTSGGAIVIDDVTLADDTLTSAVTVSNGGFENWPGGVNDPPSDWRFFAAAGAIGSITRIVAELPTPTPNAVKPENWQLY